MGIKDKAGWIFLAYCFPYVIGVCLLSYYFDYVLKYYPAFQSPGVLILAIFSVYIGLGYLCGKKGASRVCVLGTGCICASASWSAIGGRSSEGAAFL